MIFRRKPKRITTWWFQDKDGTYYRNAPLIGRELEEIAYMPFYKAARYQDQFLELCAEHDEVFSKGIRRAAAIDKGDKVTTPMRMRDAYPNHPGLWVLDDQEEKRS